MVSRFLPPSVHDNMADQYILLEDKMGEKRGLYGGRYPCILVAGRILECLSESQQPKDQEMILLKVIGTVSYTTLECEQRAVKKITQEEAALLVAVGREERLRVYRDQKLLNEAKALKIGCEVFVRRREGKTEKEVSGVVRYVGRLPVLWGILLIYGTLFGVELVGKGSKGCGDTDGTYRFDGKRYFTCPTGRGVFVSVDKLRPRQDQDQGENTGQISNGRFAELSASLDEERKAREETERRLHRSEHRTHQLELTLAAERQEHQQTSNGLQATLAAERQAHQQTLNNLQATLAAERQAHQQTSNDLQATLAAEREALQNTETRLRSNMQRLHELESSLAQEREAHRETERRLQNREERTQELQATLNTVRQVYEDYRRSIESERDWVVRRDEIRLSDEEIGRGAWGEVKEGTFRGCKVAVKKIHELILSDLNRRLFEREMTMASRCRHPCLLQFIGATNDGQSPLFVTELLDTSLRAVLHERPLEPLEIMTIALDVAKGLNYLHLSHPAPIIHRDISSANVLLWKHDTMWRAKVSDYGTANFLQQSMTASPGAIIYSAPEAQTSRQSPKVQPAAQLSYVDLYFSSFNRTFPPYFLKERKLLIKGDDTHLQLQHRNTTVDDRVCGLRC